MCTTYVCVNVCKCVCVNVCECVCVCVCMCVCLPGGLMFTILFKIFTKISCPNDGYEDYSSGYLDEDCEQSLSK